MLRRVAVLLLAVLVATTGAASCLCSAHACPMAEAAARAATAHDADGAGEAAAGSGCALHAGGSGSPTGAAPSVHAASSGETAHVVPAAHAPGGPHVELAAAGHGASGCCSGDAAAGISGPRACPAAELTADRPPAVPSAPVDAVPVAIETSVHAAMTAAEPAHDLPFVQSAAAAAPATLVSQHTSLLR